MLTRTVAIDEPLDVPTSLRRLGVGRFAADGGWWWAVAGNMHPSTLAIATIDTGIVARAWGPDADDVLARVDHLLRLGDQPVPAFAGTPAATLLKRSRTVRTGYTGDVFGALIHAICGQIVTRQEAAASVSAITRRYGEPGPGPFAMRALPAPEIIAQLSYEDLHGCGMERRRASALIEAARRHSRLAEISEMPVADGYRRLMSIRGVGQWSAALVMGNAVGDLDAVPLGDYHLPNTVAWALAGEERGTDERMEELLAPYRPYRAHVVHAIIERGIHAPRRGPKARIRSHM